jgi:hypothetical protein
MGGVRTAVSHGQQLDLQVVPLWFAGHCCGTGRSEGSATTTAHTHARSARTASSSSLPLKNQPLPNSHAASPSSPCAGWGQKGPPDDGTPLHHRIYSMSHVAHWMGAQGPHGVHMPRGQTGGQASFTPGAVMGLGRKRGPK